MVRVVERGTGVVILETMEARSGVRAMTQHLGQQLEELTVEGFRRAWGLGYSADPRGPRLV